MGGRIVDLMVNEKDPTNYYVVTATGGIFKTINNGTTFEPLFQQQSAISIGDVCISPPARTSSGWARGEHNARNSVSWGDGVYRSTDGGKTWKNMGLRKSYQIGRIAVHPTNPYIVYVGALGRLWGTSEERGVYKTTDGGESWERVLYVDDKTGCIDLQLAPDDPETIIAAMYERQRDEFDVGDPAKRWGPAADCTNRPTAARPGRSSHRACPRRRWGASASTTTARTPRSCSPSSRPSRSARTRRQRRRAGPDGHQRRGRRRRGEAHAHHCRRPGRESRPEGRRCRHGRRRQADQEVRRPGGPDRRSQGGRQGQGLRARAGRGGAAGARCRCRDRHYCG